MTEQAVTENEGRGLRQLVFQRAPGVLAILNFLAGASLLISAVLPYTLAKKGGVELPPYISVLGGFALMAMALGLAQRMRISYLVSALMLLAGAGASMAYEPSLVRTMAFALLVLALLTTRKAFFRRSDLSWLRPGGVWFFAAGLAVLLSAGMAGLWMGQKTGLMSFDFAAGLADPDTGRAVRPLVFAVWVFLCAAFARVVSSPMTPELPSHGHGDLARVLEVLKAAEGARPEAMLAYCGDKRVLFSESGRSALMYAASKTTIIAMGTPFGQRTEFSGLVLAFMKLAEGQGISAVFYSAPPDVLPMLRAHGFETEKIGENAVLELADFSLSGRKREALRRGRRKLAERRQAMFELSLPPHKPELFARLKPISDAWLAAAGGREKAFSLGRFDSDFLSHCPIGVITLGGETVAFGSLLAVPDKGWAGIDLMRYDPEKAVTNTMDFLLVELILWCQREGYGRFDLSMAPLSGLDVPEETQALFARIGHMIFTHGERFYNFRGLRRFKQKFDPVWEPRYIAAPARWLLPVGLAQAARLTNNGAPAEMAELADV